MIKSFRHRGLEEFFHTGSKRGIQPSHAARLEELLLILDQARKAQDMSLPGWRLHALQGDLQGHLSVRVNGNWRVTFSFDGEDAILTD